MLQIKGYRSGSEAATLSIVHHIFENGYDLVEHQDDGRMHDVCPTRLAPSPNEALRSLVVLRRKAAGRWFRFPTVFHSC